MDGLVHNDRVRRRVDEGKSNDSQTGKLISVYAKKEKMLFVSLFFSFHLCVNWLSSIGANLVFFNRFLPQQFPG